MHMVVSDTPTRDRCTQSFKMIEQKCKDNDTNEDVLYQEDLYQKNR